MSETSLWDGLTSNGYDFGEVSSAFQKSVRRGLEADALYWAVELDLSGYAEYLWKRMRIITSEDVGLADPVMPATIYALYELWRDLKNKKDKHKPERLPLIHAVLALVRCRKSRVIDHAICVAYAQHSGRHPIPEWALDKHTIEGKRMGRGFDHFFTEGIKMENMGNVEGEEQYLAAARSVLS